MPQAIVLVCAGIGALAMSIGTIVSYTTAAGLIPAFLYGDAGARLTTHLQWQRMPLDFPAVLLFGAIGLAASAPGQGHSWRPDWVLAASIPALGYTLWLLQTRADVLTAATASVMAALVLVVAALRVSSVSDCLRRLIGDIGSMVVSPARRAVCASVLAAVVSSPLAFHAALSGISSSEAQARAYRNWYLSQVEPLDATLRQPDRIRVTVLTDHQCQSCPAALTIADGAVEDVRHQIQMPVDLAVHLFPLNRLCNSAAPVDAHPLACDAAAAVALIRERLGPAAADGAARTLARQGMRLTPDAIEHLLTALVLHPEYLERLPSLRERIRQDIWQPEDMTIATLPLVFVDGISLPSYERSFIQQAVLAQAARRQSVQ